jgi:hypothetical protein
MNEKIIELALKAGIERASSSQRTEVLEFARLLIIEYNKELKESRRAVKSELGYSRVGLNNI